MPLGSTIPGSQESQMLLNKQLFCSIQKLRTKFNKTYIIVCLLALLCSIQVHILPAIDPGSHPRCIQPRCEGLEYFLEHRQGHLYILSNAREAENYALYAAAVQNGSLREESWQVVVPQRPDIALEDLDVFSHGVVLHERHRGRPQIRVMPAAPGAVPSLESSYLLPLPEWAVAVAAGANADFDSVKLRVELSSPVHPDRPFDWDIARKAWEPLPGPALTGHNPEDFTCHQVWALGHKGTCTGPSNGTGGVPLTLVHAKHVTLDGSAPCLVVVYGAYGHNLPVDFLPERLPLLRRGWVVALVHARGGGELGRRWHAAGRGTAKRATATDVETAIHYLVAHGKSKEGKLPLVVMWGNGCASFKQGWLVLHP